MFSVLLRIIKIRTGKIALMLNSICTNRVLVEFSLLVENDSVFMVKILHSFHSIIHNRNFFYYNKKVFEILVFILPLPNAKFIHGKNLNIAPKKKIKR
ncbi:hypothetical protein BpHYR1_037252 [Brachionus plicatilis]|uniref:Uncharacterized protein n=1 Tax=Brachionus plicatilis TaxID=10195 RepID=A0A3M7PWC2_BRAPC|nr:hypothetical protein BpHYR1_037252 [Brachionus plicatilis]